MSEKLSDLTLKFGTFSDYSRLWSQISAK